MAVVGVRRRNLRKREWARRNRSDADFFACSAFAADSRSLSLCSSVWRHRMVLLLRNDGRAVACGITEDGECDICGMRRQRARPMHHPGA